MAVNHSSPSSISTTSNVELLPTPCTSAWDVPAIAPDLHKGNSYSCNIIPSKCIMGTIKLVPQIMLFALVFTNIIATHQAWGEKECYGEKESIKHKCKENISIIDDYVRPGQECCHVVKESDMICVCRILSIEEESTISAVKLFYVARDCGNPVPVGKKCG
ncbi:hypothetical protein EJB05_57802, partial [Eragrostis curvula]